MQIAADTLEMSRSRNSAYDTKEQGSTTSTSTSSPDISNPGQLRWQQIREEWRQGSGQYTVNPSSAQRGYNPSYQQQLRRRPANTGGEPARVNVDYDEVIDRLFSSTGNMTLPESMPLCQMIEVLTDVWETEGLYD